MKKYLILAALFFGGCGSTIRLGYTPPMSFYIEIQTHVTPPPPPQPATTQPA